MRLSSSQAKTIKDTVTRVVDSGARVWLFGSRLDDALRGGDIDLYVETDQVMPNRIETLCRLEGALIMALGDRKLDILMKDARTRDAPIFRIAREQGVLL
jgi:predicted nucleotidyltransferase